MGLRDVFFHWKITRAEDVYAFVLLQHEQVFVAGDNAIAFTADGNGKVLSSSGSRQTGLSSFEADTTIILDRRALAASAANSCE